MIAILFAVCLAVFAFAAPLPSPGNYWHLEITGTPPLLGQRVMRRVWNTPTAYHEYFHAPDPSFQDNKWDHWYNATDSPLTMITKVHLPTSKAQDCAIENVQVTTLCVWGDQTYNWGSVVAGQTCQRLGLPDTTCDRYLASNQQGPFMTTYYAYYLPNTSIPVSLYVDPGIPLGRFWMYVTAWHTDNASASANLTACIPVPIPSSSNASSFDFSSSVPPAPPTTSSDSSVPPKPIPPSSSEPQLDPASSASASLIAIIFLLVVATLVG